MVKVALINPGKDERFAVQEPLHLGFIASYLEKNGIRVIIIDELAGQNVKEEIIRFSPDIVGLTATTPLVADAYRIAEICKKMGILTVMGGVHASILPEEVLQHVDIVIKGEGEKALLKIINEGIKSGTVEGEFIKNLDEIPPPARHLMQMEFYVQSKDRLPDTYLQFVPPKTRVAALLTSRGCPYDCIFCHNSWKGLPFRFNSPERVMQEIDDLVKTYKIKAIFFIEDNLFVHKKRITRICEMLIERNYDLIWGGNARVDNVDLELLKLAKRASCRQVTFGFESGSQKILDLLKKRTTVEQIKRAVALCKEADISVNGTFMIGNPDETEADIRLTQKMIRELPIDSMGVCLTTPFPGTELWNMAQRQGGIPKDLKWSDFAYDKVPIRVNQKMQLKEIEKFYYETVDIVRSKSPLGLKSLFFNYLRHPRQALPKLISALRHPSRFKTFFERLKSR